MKSSEAALLEAERLIRAAVAEAYYSAQLARENVAIAKADEAFNERQLREAKARRRAGSGSLSDVLNFEIQMNAARGSSIDANRAYITALTGLAELMAFPDAAFPEALPLAELPEETEEDLAKPDRGNRVAYAKGHRPDMVQAEYGVKRAQAGVGRSRAPFYPTVSTYVSKDAVRSKDFDFGEDDFGTTIGVNVSYNLFAGGRDIGAMREAKAIRSESEHELHRVGLMVAGDVHRALAELRAAQERVALERDNASYVERNRDLVEKEYRAGQASLVRLNEAQRDLIRAQGSLALARVSLFLAWHNLETATGESLGR